MTILTLAAEIGGILGLWLGFSVLDMYSSLEAGVASRINTKSLFV